MTTKDDLMAKKEWTADEKPELLKRAGAASPARHRRVVVWDEAVVLSADDQREFDALRVKPNRTARENIQLGNLLLRFASKVPA